MGPGNDKDATNGTPQDQSNISTATPAATSSSTQKNESDSILEKYKKLKRRFFELEEKHKETSSELQRSSERNVRIRQERNMLLERIMELEAQPQFKANGGELISSTLDQPPSSAFPRSLLTARARSSFINNLRQAAEDEGITASTDTTTPRNIGVAADERPAKRARTLNGESRDATASPGPNGSATPRLHIQTSGAPDSPAPDSSHPTYTHPPVPPPNPYDRPLTPPTPLADHFLPQGGIIRPSPISEDAPMQIDTTRASPSATPQQPGLGASEATPEKAPEDASIVEQSISTSLPVSASRSETAAEPDPAPAPTRRSTRARRPVNYNDDEPTVSPSKNEKIPPARKTRAAAKPSNPEASGASNSSSAPSNPIPGAASSVSSSAPVQTPTPTPMHNINPILMGATGAIAGNGSVPSTSMSPPAPSPTMGINPYSVYYPTPSATATPAHPFPYSYYYMPGSGLMPPGMMPPGAFPPGPPMPSHPGTSQSPPQQRPTSESQRQARPKRLKAHTVTSKSYSIPMVPRDKSNRPMLPLNVGIMTVISLGEVCMREHFHTERYIFPVGYEVTRRYLSTIDPNIEVVYHCTILDGGDGPKFQIVPSDVADKPVIAGTATGAWSSIVKQANAIRNRQHSNSVSGPDFFGLGQNTIKHLIQQLPNADKLRDYVWQNFVEGGPLGGRHAAVIPALPEEYDSSVPIGPYYPSTSEKLRREQLAVQAGQPRKSHYPPHVMARAAQEAQNNARQQQAQQQHPPQPIPQPQPMPQQPQPTSQPQPQPQPPPLHPQQLGISESAADAATFASLISAYGAAQAGGAVPAGMMAGGPPPSGPPPS